jgi:Helicase HerA, central domain
MITADQRAALEELTFNPAPTPDDVWRPSPYNVPELHERVVREILTGVNRARREEDATPLGVAMQGRAGAGKTHLLGAVREQIQREGGFFFLVNLINGKTFWESTALCIVEGMGHDAIGWGTQLKTFLRWLTAHLGIPAEVRDAVAGDVPLTRADLDTFIHALRRFNREVGRECQDTARALVLHGAQDFEAQDVGYAHLIGAPGDPAGRAVWGMTPELRSPQLVVRDISRLIALTLSPTVIAVDQLDTLFAQTSTALFDQREGLDDAQAKLVAPVADGLLTLRDITRRTLLVVACLPDTWVLLTKSAPTPVIGRFREAVLPDRIPTAQIGAAIIEKRLTSMYARRGFVAPYPTWPVLPDAFADAPNLTPRALLRRVDSHVKWCLDHDEVVELDRLVDPQPSAAAGQSARQRDLSGFGAETELKRLDDRFAELVESADVRAALTPATEDNRLPELLAAGLEAWIGEQAPTGRTYKCDPPPPAKPALHGRLIEVLDEATENEAHWAFRAIASGSAVAVINRVKAACTMAGLDQSIPQRKLVLLRNGPWPTGPRTREVTDGFLAAGGSVHELSHEDLKVFAALREMSARPPAEYQEWLVTRRHASNTALFRDVLGEHPDAPADPGVVGVDEVDPSVGGGPSIQLGHTVEDRRPFLVDIESLRRHTVIFAGSGSGKTVLIRRLVEECARQGVSAIVLDPNNDLARLGDPWPRQPAGWAPGDDERARDYLDNTDVVVWTPRVAAGRSLAFQPLPDFGPVRDSPDEFDQAIRSAVEALAPRAGVNGATKLAQQGKAVLTEALQAYARSGGGSLHGFTEYLAELPDGVSRMAKAAKLAHDAAETLKAAMVTDPLFGGEGTAVDPGILLTPPAGKRARVSVISFVGLSSDEQRQSFVNQMQMSLFAWIKRHPAGDRPLGGLFVMDEAQTLAPASGKTPCTASSIALASQARKYGLGLVFATQSPKGLHNQISGNATTQFFGLLNAPAQIEAARELAQAKGGRLPDIGLLTSGEFYAAGEGFALVKVKTPMCLTHHPKAPLSPEEVVQRAEG